MLPIPGRPNIPGEVKESHSFTVYSREMLDGDGKSRVATWSQKREWVRHAFARFQEAGYHVSSGYTLVRDAERCKFV